MNRRSCFMPVVLGLAMLAALRTADAEIICQHLGLADPTSEGFVLQNDSRMGHSARWAADPGWDGVANNSPTGEDAWWFGSTNNKTASLSNYQYALSTTQMSAMNSQGWRAEMRVLNNLMAVNGGPDSGTDYGIGLCLLTSTLDFEIYIGTDSSDNVTLYKWTAGGLSEVAIPATNAKYAYNTFTMTAAPGDSQATILVNGVAVGVVDGVEGSYTPALAFGSFASSGIFSADYSQVTLSTLAVPEPSSLALVCSVACTLGYCVRRKRNPPGEQIIRAIDRWNRMRRK